MRDEILPPRVELNGHIAGTRSEGIDTPDFEPEATRSGLNFHDVLFVLFRQKWKIFLCTIAGIIAAAAAYLFFPRLYESEAKLFVRYVVDKSAIDGLDSQIKTPNPQTDTAISSEVEILTSSDLAREVAEAVGIERLVAGTGAQATIEKAMQTLSHGLGVSVLKGTNVIGVSFKSTDPKLPVLVLQEMVKRYFDKHLEVHRSAGAFKFVTKEAEELRAALNQTEGELNQLKNKTGILSLAETKSTLAKELGKSQEELDTVESELAVQHARVKAIETSLAITDANQSGAPLQPVSGDVVQKYQSLVARFTQFQQAETELLSKYTPKNRLVKVKQAQIEDLESQRRELEKKYPGLIGTAQTAGQSQTPKPDIVSERAHLVGIESLAVVLRSRVSALQQRAKLVSEFGPRIEQLERNKEVEETNYKNSQASLEKARIDETLDPSRIPNISVVQSPSDATKDPGEVRKLVFGLSAGGLIFGIAIALLIELVLDRTVKRAYEFEGQLQIPLLLSIPHLSTNGQRLRLYDAERDSERAPKRDGDSDVFQMENGDSLRPFCEGIRDRLGLFFDLDHMAHRPKLVAVTGLAKNAGASTLAAGLARTLSDGADGKVLLVDKPPATRRFYNMLIEFKGSDLDYVVFDMPSLGATSSTLPLAGFMDTVLLVVEAEKSNRAAVKRAYTQLAARTRVAVVLNKSRSYGPRWLEADL
jgi:succinoglycan biosynthesis transport protein ExoP